MDRRTIKKVLANVAPIDETAAGGVYALRDFIEALLERERSGSALTNYEAEKTRLTAAQADIAEVDRAERRDEVLRVETILGVWQNLAYSIKRVILQAKISTAEQDSILSELKSVTMNAYLEQKKETDDNI